jgi:microcystin-dependent protein
MDAFIGEILLFPYGFAPKSWAACEGQILSIAQYQALFSLIGTTFGGDGQNNFALPDLRGKAPIDGMAYYIALIGIFPARS